MYLSNFLCFTHVFIGVYDICIVDICCRTLITTISQHLYHWLTLPRYTGIITELKAMALEECLSHYFSICLSCSCRPLCSTCTSCGMYLLYRNVVVHLWYVFILWYYNSVALVCIRCTVI